MRLAAVLAFMAASCAMTAQEPDAIRIWKGTAPGSDAAHWPKPDYKEAWEQPGQVLTGVTDPSIQVYLPDAAVNTGAAVVVCPGGGYKNLWIAKEGWTIARELQKRGIAGIVLKYRHYDMFAAVDDAQRAMRYVRSRAAEWKINAKAVGIGGFSAGGHLALHMAAQGARQPSWTPDEVDKLSARPDFIMAIYPGVNLSPSAVVDASFPPTFFAVAADDKATPAPKIAAFFLQLRGMNVPAELHIYDQGGHGFGAGRAGCFCEGWLDLFRRWLQARGAIAK